MPDQPYSQPALEGFGIVPQTSEEFRNVPNASEAFRNVRKDSEPFRSEAHHSERKENHTLTVREVARLFEDAGVARTERSITNWCQPNAQGMARLDAYFDPNERRYFITQQSVTLAIAEEQAKAAKAQPQPESPRTIPNDSETLVEPGSNQPPDADVDRLNKEVMDLKILNKGKDFLIDQLKQEREGIFDQLLESSRKVGELETRLLQLGPPTS